ncbi:hypothetical protein GJAV_G00144790 [Gymnothorax javanicus]|nr:hypothetical protein GJAV_G00144790 [Gymnothorax javanicus]
MSCQCCAMATLLHCFILLVLVSSSSWSADVKSKDQFQWLNSGESFTMRCSTTETDVEGLYLRLGLDTKKEVFYLHGQSKKLTTGEKYSSRLQTAGIANNLEIKLANMTEDDSGVYLCEYTRLNSKTGSPVDFAGQGSKMVVVNGRQCNTTNAHGTVLTSSLVMVSAISAASVLLLCLTVLLLWLVPKMKKSMRKRHGHARRSDSVYEDMRKTSSLHKAHQPSQPTNHFP